MPGQQWSTETSYWRPVPAGSGDDGPDGQPTVATELGYEPGAMSIVPRMGGGYRAYFSDLEKPGAPPGGHYIRSAVSDDLEALDMQAWALRNVTLVRGDGVTESGQTLVVRGQRIERCSLTGATGRVCGHRPIGLVHELPDFGTARPDPAVAGGVAGVRLCLRRVDAPGKQRLEPGVDRAFLDAVLDVRLEPVLDRPAHLAAAA